MPTSMLDPSQDPLIGRIVAGKYRVVQPIARGGMSRIYRAIQLPLGRSVALKLLTPLSDRPPDREQRERFFREAATCAKLSHPNTVTVHDYGALEGFGTLYMVMELVEGRNVSQELEEHGPLHPMRVARIGCEVARSLHEAHSMDVIHRDLKSSNVMLVPTLEGESIKVVDFGIAKLVGPDDDPITVEHAVLGSPGYMAPEQIIGGTVDARSDIYALGAVMYEALTGRRPYSGATSHETMMAHLQQPPTPIRQLARYPVSPEFARVVESCLMRDPARRPESAAALLAQLRAAVPEMPGSWPITLATRSSVPPAPRRRAQRMSWTQVGLALGVVMLVLALSGIAVLSAVASVLANLGVLTVQPAPAPNPIELAPGPAPAAPPTERPAPADSEPATPNQDAGATSAEAPPPAPHAATLTIETIPSYAFVTDGAIPIGYTPITVPLPSGGPERVYRVQLDGYEPTTVIRGPSDHDDSVQLRLVPSPRGAPHAPPHRPTLLPPPNPSGTP